MGSRCIFVLVLQLYDVLFSEGHVVVSTVDSATDIQYTMLVLARECVVCVAVGVASMRRVGGRGVQLGRLKKRIT